MGFRSYSNLVRALINLFNQVSGPMVSMAFTQFPNVAQVIGGLPFEAMPHVTFYDAEVLPKFYLT